MLSVECPHCGKVLQISEKYAGKTGTCAGCKGSITVPPLAQAGKRQEASPRHDDPKVALDQSDNIAYMDMSDAAYMQPRVITGSGASASSSKPVASFVCSLVGLFVCPIILSIIGIVLGYQAKRDGENGLATAGIVIGWLGIAFFVVGIIIWVALLGSMGIAMDQAMQEVQGGGEDPIVTMSEFNRIREGMSYREVVDIIGHEGEVMSEGGAEYGHHTVMYSWENPGALQGNMTAMFQNDRLVNKAQFMLSD